MEFKLSAILLKEEKFFVAKGIEIELASQGKTVQEALNNLKEAFQLWIKHAEPSELAVFKKTDTPILTQVIAAA